MNSFAEQQLQELTRLLISVKNRSPGPGDDHLGPIKHIVELFMTEEEHVRFQHLIGIIP